MNPKQPRCFFKKCIQVPCFHPCPATLSPCASPATTTVDVNPYPLYPLHLDSTSFTEKNLKMPKFPLQKMLASRTCSNMFNFGGEVLSRGMDSDHSGHMFTKGVVESRAGNGNLDLESADC